jgi:hypothetical protein
MNDCGRECYIIGGPWIAEDPDCPVHGAEAVAERERQVAEREDLQEALKTALARASVLEERLGRVTASLTVLVEALPFARPPLSQKAFSALVDAKAVLRED